ncbi:hypothetical protein ACLOJK_025256 [Asimina triloba]
MKTEEGFGALMMEAHVCRKVCSGIERKIQFLEMDTRSGTKPYITLLDITSANGKMSLLSWGVAGVGADTCPTFDWLAAGVIHWDELTLSPTVEASEIERVHVRERLLSFVVMYVRLITEKSAMRVIRFGIGVGINSNPPRRDPFHQWNLAASVGSTDVGW